MIYAQGFFHLDECNRSKSQFAPCGCDLLKLKNKAAIVSLEEFSKSIPAPSQSEVSQIEEA